MPNHRQAHYDLLECSAHTQCDVPGLGQKVECLIDIIACTDSTLKLVIVLVRDNTKNKREDFEAAASSLIEVCPYCRTSSSAGRNADMSSVDFKSRRG